MIQVHVYSRWASSDDLTRNDDQSRSDDRSRSKGHSVALKYHGQNIETIVDLLQIDRTDIGVIIVNGRHARIADPVFDGSEIFFMPSIDGG